LLLWVVVTALTLGLSSPAKAGIIFFNSRTAWQAAAGNPSFIEDFSGFAADTPFRTSPVALNGMTIQQEGPSLGVPLRNVIDVPPLTFSEGNGTSAAQLITNFPEGADPGTQVRIAFVQPNSAFGFESWQANSAEGAVLEVFDGATLLGSQVLTNGDGAFLGYVLTGGDTATLIRFGSATLLPGSAAEGFAIDNLVGVNASGPSGASPVPEPGSLALLGFGTIGVLGYGRWRQRRGKVD
jgi:hypothetical protein